VCTCDGKCSVGEVDDETPRRRTTDSLQVSPLNISTARKHYDQRTAVKKLADPEDGRCLCASGGNVRAVDGTSYGDTSDSLLALLLNISPAQSIETTVHLVHFRTGETTVDVCKAVDNGASLLSGAEHQFVLSAKSLILPDTVGLPCNLSRAATQ
jgi:hypothetical protein